MTRVLYVPGGCETGCSSKSTSIMVGCCVVGAGGGFGGSSGVSIRVGGGLSAGGGGGRMFSTGGGAGLSTRDLRSSCGTITLSSCPVVEVLRACFFTMLDGRDCGRDCGRDGGCVNLRKSSSALKD